MQAEYIAKIKGDTSQLEKALKKAQGSMNKLSEDEVLIKLNYDGNIKGFNKTFDSILKACPELTIQFQYDVNKKILEQELNKLNTLNDFKLDVDSETMQKKIKNMVSEIKSSFKEGSISEDEFIQKIKYLYKYINTADELGFEIDSSQIKNAFKDMTQYADLINKLSKSKQTLFPIDDSGVEGMIEKQTKRVEELKSVLDSLRSKGASELGSSSEASRLEDEIKIINEHIRDLQEQMDGLSGEAFDEIKNSVEDLNEKLELTIKKIKEIRSPSEESLGDRLREWQQQGYTEREHAVGFNSKTKQSLTETILGTKESVSGKLVEEAAKEVEGTVDSILHTHPYDIAAASDDDLETWFKQAKRGIQNQYVMSLKEAMTLDMSAIKADRSDDILSEVRAAYDKIDKEFDDNYVNKYIKEAQEIGNAVFDSVKTPSPIVSEIVSEAKKNFNKIFEGNKGGLTFSDYCDAVDGALADAAEQSSHYSSLTKENLKTLKNHMADIGLAITEPIQNAMTEEAQGRYQQVLMAVFKNPKYIKEGVSSAIKVESLDDFIDYNSVRKSVEKVVEATEKATADAQKSGSPSKVAERLGEYWTEGYADGIVKHKDQVEDAVRQLVETAKLTMQDLLEDLSNITANPEYADLVNPVKNVLLSSTKGQSGSQYNDAIKTVSPTQTFDNEIQKNLTYLENYKNTIKEIDRLKLEPETEETRKKLEELNTLADYFASHITVIRSENQGEVDRSMMRFGFDWNETLRRNYTEEQRKAFYKIAGEKTGLRTNQEVPQFHYIKDELNSIESQSEKTRQSLNETLANSASYVKHLKSDFLDLIDTKLELKVETNKRDIELYEKDIANILKKYPELEQFLDKFTSFGAAKKFAQSDEWNDFLATLPQAHAYLESIGYDFERVNDQTSGQPARELLTSEQAFAQYGESLDEVAKKSQYTKNQLEELYKSGRNQMAASSAVDVLAEAYESVSKASEKASSDIGDATDSIKKEGKAAEESARQKDKFTKANQEAAKSGEETAKSAKKAADAVKGQEKVFKENSDLTKWLSEVQSGIRTVEFDVALNKEMAEAEIKKIAATLAEEFNKAYGTSVTGAQVARAYKASLEERRAAEKEQEAALKAAEKQREAVLQAEHKMRHASSAADEKLITEFATRDNSLSRLEDTLYSDIGLLEKFADRFDDVRKALNGISNTNDLKLIDQQIKDLTSDVNAEVSAMKVAAKESEKAEREREATLQYTQKVNQELAKMEKAEGDKAHLKEVNDILASYKELLDATRAVNDLTKKSQKDSSAYGDALSSAQERLRAAGKEIERIQYYDKLSILDDSQLDVIDKIISKIEVAQAETEALNNAQEKAASNEAIKNSNSLYDRLEATLKEIFDLQKATLSLDSETELGKTRIADNEKAIAEKSQQALDIYQKINDASAVQEERENRLLQLSEEREVVLSRMMRDQELQSRDDMSSQVGKWITQVEALQKSGKYTQEFTKELNEALIALRSFDSAAGSIEEVNTAFEKLEATMKDINSSKGLSEFKRAQESSIAKLNLQIEEFMQKNSRMGSEFQQKFKNLKLDFDAETSLDEVQKLVAEFAKLKSEVTAAGKTGASFFDTLRQRVLGVNAQLIAQYLSWQDMIRYARQAIEVIKDLDYALVDLKKTTTMTSGELKDFYYSANDTAKQMGVTTEQIINQAAAWSRLNKLGLICSNA